ncbi:uncharacterized protein BdWA1_004049, partial [Babesia duncani]
MGTRALQLNEFFDEIKMATIFTMEMGSEESDSDYSLSDTSVTHNEPAEDDVKLSKKQLLKEQRRLKRQRELEEKAETIFNDLLKESEIIYSHEQAIPLNDDFMLQFHKRSFDGQHKISSLDELDHHLDVGTSRILDNYKQIGISEYKQMYRS